MLHGDTGVVNYSSQVQNPRWQLTVHEQVSDNMLRAFQEDEDLETAKRLQRDVLSEAELSTYKSPTKKPRLQGDMCKVSNKSQVPKLRLQHFFDHETGYEETDETPDHLKGCKRQKRAYKTTNVVLFRLMVFDENNNNDAATNVEIRGKWRRCDDEEHRLLILRRSQRRRRVLVDLPRTSVRRDEATCCYSNRLLRAITS